MGSTGPIGRPIGAERQRLGPSPLGAGMGPQARKVDPFGVWDLPPSYSGDMSTNLTSSANSNTDSNFSYLQYNGGSGGAPGSALDPGSIGGQTPGFGLSPSITPSKVDYSDWGTGSTSGSAPGSTGKGAPGAPAHQDPFRAGGPDAVRR